MTDSFAKATSGRMNYYDLSVYSEQVSKLHVGDELNLYLVHHGLKPATEIPFYTLLPPSRIGPANGSVLRSEEDVSQFKELLDTLGLAHEEMRTETRLKNKRVQKRKSCHVHTRGIHRKSPIRREAEFGKYKQRVNFHIGKDEESLNRLTAAFSSENKYGKKWHEDVGLALGYPEAAADAFLYVIDGIHRTGFYMTVCMAEAKKAGIELPTWLAYISHVPEQLDLVNNDVSPSSMELGEKYQSFVREHNPVLANRVEEHFKNEKLPERWAKHEESYVLDYGHRKKFWPYGKTSSQELKWVEK